MTSNTAIFLILIPLAFLAGMLFYTASPHYVQLETPVATENKTPPPPQPTITPTSTPKPLSFAQMNSLYGPCTVTPVLMYHHIQDLDQAKKEGHLGLAVSPAIFSQQMQYLADRGFRPVTADRLNNFFDSGAGLPAKSVLLTFDDGYADFFQNAYPILKLHHFPAILFLPTGLTDNPGYITWNQAVDMSFSAINIANHTWSHRNMKSDAASDLKEITTADTQLAEHNLNHPKAFAYPYGIIGSFAKTDLANLGYHLAFTTFPGRILCKKNNLTLPRVRIGNSPLSAYGI